MFPKPQKVPFSKTNPKIDPPMDPPCIEADIDTHTSDIGSASVDVKSLSLLWSVGRKSRDREVTDKILSYQPKTDQVFDTNSQV